jgi:prolyl-tRNA editing enzyme YbaK/EbsC (Cys-tRNA(Pro) deacylase)
MSDHLDFRPAMTRPWLLADPVRERIAAMRDEQRELVQVAEIDPRSAGGIEFCDRYGIRYDAGANCVLIEASRSAQVIHAACVITPGSRTDLNGFVRRHLGMRRVTLMPKESAITETRMEYGSMTPVGLPDDWRVLVDSRVAGASTVVIGSGRVISKLRLPAQLLLEMCRGEPIDDLAKV